MTFNTGYTNFIGNNRSIADASSYLRKGMEMVPVKAGLKYFATDKLYMQAEAGAGFY